MEARLPNDLALERDTLGACLARPERILEIGLSGDDFALDAHRLTWGAMVELAESNAAVNLVTVRAKLLDADNLAAVGGEKFLEKLRQVVPAKALPIDRLKKMARLRKLRAQAEAVAAAAAGFDPDLAAAELEATLAYASDDVVRGPKNARQLAEEWLAALDRDPDEGTVSPGLSALKRRIGRLDAGSMTLIGADVNVGKSTLSLEMMVRAMFDGESVGMLSMEDPERIVTGRVMSLFGGVSPKAIRKFRPGGPFQHEISKATELMFKLGDRLMVSNCIGMNEREVLDEMTAMAKRGARLIVLDYIGVVGSSQKHQNRVNEIREIATRLKARAARLGVALVMVSQFSRPKENDPSKKPNKHSFRESGDLEAMAEYAIVMWRTVEDDFAPVYCELAKSKTGGVGHSWVMQRECTTEDGRPGSGRLIEVAFEGDVILDDDGNPVKVRTVIPDPSGQDRWNTRKG